MIKECRICKRLLAIDYFFKSARNKDGHQFECKPCFNKMQNESRKRHWDKYLARQNRNNKKNMPKRRKLLLSKVLEYYGNKCNCCGINDERFLTIDHVNNDGFKDRRLNHIALCSKIIKQNFPKTFQLLCWNCNCARSIYDGICPHKIIKI